MTEQTDMQNLLQEFPEAQLQIRDRLPYNFLLSQSIMTFQKAILNIQYSAEELREAAEGLVNMIPAAWKDKNFEEDLMHASIGIPVNATPAFCEIPASEEYCRKHGIETVTVIKSFDYFKVFNAVINLLNRRHMLLKLQYKEIFTGRKAKKGQKAYEPEETEF